MLLPAARELLSTNPVLDAGVLAVLPFLIAALIASWFVRDAGSMIPR